MVEVARMGRKESCVMKRLAVVLCVLHLLVSPAAAFDSGAVGAGRGTPAPGTRDDPCPQSTLLLNYDGSAENGYCWHYHGTIPPYFGAFAECYPYDPVNAEVCGIQLHLTSLDYPCLPLDAYVWQDEAGVPGQVLSMTPALDPCPVSQWPSVSTHDLALEPVLVSGSYWVGFWVDLSMQPCGWFVAADTDGPGGCPYTNIAPGIGYPSGWQSVSVVWGPTQAVGIGAWARPAGENATAATSWGHVKLLYR